MSRALVGDIIVGVRSMIPDMPAVLQPPPALPFQSGGAGDLPAANFYAFVSYLTPWGETTPAACVNSGSFVLNLASNLSIVVSAPPYFSQPAYTTVRVYIGTNPNQVEWSYQDFTNVAPGAGLLVTAIPAQAKPLQARNTAYMPDWDGNMFSATVIFSWLRDALRQAGDLTQGIYDATGISTTSGVAAYQLTGDWKKMTHAWFDGWPLDFGNKGDSFYRNKNTAVSGSVFVDMRGVASIVEYYMVPDRSGGTTILSSPMAATDTSAQVNDLSGFLLDYGLVQIGSEIMAYSSMNPGLSNILRGFGGTLTQAWPTGTAVQELNGRFAGYRYPIDTKPGMSLQPLDAPPAWEPKIQLFLESRYYQAMKKHKEASEARNTFNSEMKALSSQTLTLLGPQQVGGAWQREAVGSGMGGGWLIP
jgi:hypothetical protein